jgi:hypothetical protein
MWRKPMDDERVEAVRALLAETEAAHAAYETSELNGVYDQEWPQWYAAYAVDHGIANLLGRDVTSDQLADSLARAYAEFAQSDPAPPEPWASFVARRILAQL